MRHAQKPAAGCDCQCSLGSTSGRWRLADSHVWVTMPGTGGRLHVGVVRYALGYAPAALTQPTARRIWRDTMDFTEEHEAIRRNVKRFIDAEINPHVDEWEAAGAFPAHELFKKLGRQGYLGINKPAKYGGQGLDYSYQLAF